MSYSPNMFPQHNDVTGAKTLAAKDRVAPITAISTSFTLTLPNAATSGRGHRIVVADETGQCSGAKKVTINVDGGGTISGGASVDLDKAYQAITFNSNGTNWFKIADPLANAGGGPAAATPPEFLIPSPRLVTPIHFEQDTFNFIPV